MGFLVQEAGKGPDLLKARRTPEKQAIHEGRSYPLFGLKRNRTWVVVGGSEMAKEAPVILVDRWPTSRYSIRKAWVGLMDAARRAGIQAATSATRTSKHGTSVNVTTSCGLMP